MKTGRTRPRGFIEWKPQAGTLGRLQQVNEILTLYREHLPLTIRQIFYRLVSVYGYPKTERDYNNLCETLNRARRARIIDMNAIRDDGFHLQKFQGYFDGDHWLEATRNDLQHFQLDRQQGQPRRVIVWCEAAGMVPQLERVAAPYSVPVASSGGFDSTSAKHSAAKWLARIGPALVLHIGDHDPSGVHMFGSLDEDVSAFAAHYGGDIGFLRLAVTPEQIDIYNLPTAPAKVTDRRRFEGLTTQCEALDPELLARITRTAIEGNLDLEVYYSTLDIEAEIKEQLEMKMADLFIADGEC